MPLPYPTGLERKAQNSRIGMNTGFFGGRSHLFFVLVKGRHTFSVVFLWKPIYICIAVQAQEHS